MFLDKLNEVLASKKPFISDRWNFAGIAASLFINIIHWLLLYFKVKPGSVSMLLHYNVVYGPDLVDKGYYVYFVPAIALGALALNSGLAAFFYSKEKLAAWFLSMSTVAVQLVFLAASIAIIIVNE